MVAPMPQPKASPRTQMTATPIKTRTVIIVLVMAVLTPTLASVTTFMTPFWHRSTKTIRE